MKKSVCQIFNKNCLETGLKPDIPAINAAALEYVKRSCCCFFRQRF